MVKKDNNFTLYPSKTILLALVAIIIFFVIPTKTILASPLPSINVPLDSWVYPAISRFETLQAFEGNSIALNTIPLTRFEIASLSLIQCKMSLKERVMLLIFYQIIYPFPTVLF
ncbi:hypothetical protein CVT91_12300 [Candidatus Atribacteria bacterium HGW-Atribacteria-1]|nr:MAG: hypothetical protein CVT91_12300 [Candidatus Atribacteria bacterium HGW-Atribacteria-1]